MSNRDSGNAGNPSRLALGVVMEWRKLDHAWTDHSWRPIEVIAGAPELDPTRSWALLRQEDDRATYHAGTLPLTLHPGETDGYRMNLSQKPPRIFVVLRRSEESGAQHEVMPFRVTACPYEAQEYLDGDETVEPVPMPAAVIGFLQDFVARRPPPQPFEKRKRKSWRETTDVGRRSSRLPPQGESDA